MIATALLAIAVTPADYPLVVVLDEARATCSVALASDDPQTPLITAGWARVMPTAGDWIDRAIREDAAMFGPAAAPTRAFTKVVGGRSLVTFVAIAKIKSSHLRLCTVRDRHAKLESAAPQVMKWAGRGSRSPSFVGSDMAQKFDALSFTRNWAPGLDDGADDTTIRYVPPEYSEPNGGITYSSEIEIKAEVGHR